MQETGLVFLYAACLIATFIAWYICVIVPKPIIRGLLRATIIAVLCSPGILIGHGIGIAPTLFALYVQPSLFTLGSMLIVWVIAICIMLGVPALRNDRSKWPPSRENIFLDAYWFKFFLFGVIAATLMRGFAYADHWQGLWAVSVVYGLFFVNAIMNLVLCYWARRRRAANPLTTPMLFAAPALLVAAPTVAFMCYGGGAIGGLIGGGRWRSACWVSLGIFSLLFINSIYRIYAAATAPAHVTIGGGIAGNAAMAAVFAALAIAPWLFYRRRHQGEPSL